MAAAKALIDYFHSVNSYSYSEEALADTYDCRSYLLRLTSYFWEQFIHSFEHLCYLFKGLSLNASQH